jgi:hypothetical protein
MLISTHAPQDFADMVASSPALGFLAKSALPADSIRDRVRGSAGLREVDHRQDAAMVLVLRPGCLAGHDLTARTARQLEQILDHEIDPPLSWWLLDHDAGTVLRGSRHVARPSRERIGPLPSSVGFAGCWSRWMSSGVLRFVENAAAK